MPLKGQVRGRQNQPLGLVRLWPLMTLMRAVEMRTCAKRVKKIKKGEEVELINTQKKLWWKDTRKTKAFQKNMYKGMLNWTTVPLEKDGSYDRELSQISRCSETPVWSRPHAKKWSQQRGYTEEIPQSTQGLRGCHTPGFPRTSASVQMCVNGQTNVWTMTSNPHLFHHFFLAHISMLFLCVFFFFKSLTYL